MAQIEPPADPNLKLTPERYPLIISWPVYATAVKVKTLRNALAVGTIARAKRRGQNAAV